MDTILFAFSDRAVTDEWYAINDTVMGGVSDSHMTATADGAAAFTGEVSLESGGGFASVRCRPGRYDLRGFAGIRLLLSGDGRRYKLQIRTDTGSDEVQYQAPFVTEGGGDQTIDLDFAEFVPVRRGRQVEDAPALDLSSISSFGFLISDKQAGPFRLEIRSVNAYR